LKFDPALRKFYGNPSTTDLIKNSEGYYSDYSITLIARDVPALSIAQFTWYIVSKISFLFNFKMKRILNVINKFPTAVGTISD
jgi:hypothetical protein